mmetsp:Transcript_1564/g.4028  ORF Transcript_1564/g.4028 Transcript_1564/m.4028 type:complete len:456 (-) Transcript_1564:67-1434(-)
MGCAQHKAVESAPPEKVVVAADPPPSTLSNDMPDPPTKPQATAEPKDTGNKADVVLNTDTSVAEMETRASSQMDGGSIEDPFAKVEAIVEDALKDVAESLAQDDWFVAERVLMDAIELLQEEGEIGEKGIERLKQSESFKRVLKALREYEEVTAAALGTGGSDAGPEWKLAAEVPLDYKALKMILSAEAEAALPKEDRVITFYWRQLPDGGAQVRASAALPVEPANAQGKNTLMAWLALVLENELASTWHPIVVGNGPKLIEPRTKWRTIWMNLQKLLFFKQAIIEELHHFANEDTGVIVTRAVQHPDNAENKALWEKNPPAKGYTKSPDCFNITVVCVPQQHTCYFNGCIHLTFKSPPPGFLLKVLATWLFPEMIRRMLKATMSCLAQDGPYHPLLTEDKFGCYALTKKMVQTGAEADKAGAHEGKILGPRVAPKASVVTNRAKSLTKFADGAR